MGNKRKEVIDLLYIEMSRELKHGGGTWAFPNCLWSPTKKRNGRTWPFWSKILDLQKGDIVVHLRGIPPNAHFTGYSVVTGDGYETEQRPPDPGEWSFAKRFFRADLTGYVPFNTPINLNDILRERDEKLNAYFDSNKSRGANKLNIFYVRQAGRLQCQNGGYLSDLDNQLFSVLFDRSLPDSSDGNTSTFYSVETGQQLTTIKARIGQADFAKRVKDLYGGRCCFPGCQVADRRFLIGAHIARWSDNEFLRGELGNGLCYCLIHDKAFEIGLFTLDEEYKVFINPREQIDGAPIMQELITQEGEQIRLAEILPMKEALLEHWSRNDLVP